MAALRSPASIVRMAVERTLHHFPLDPASRQVRLALGEKRLAFAEVLERYWERPPELPALNPSGLTAGAGREPTAASALVLCESRAILEHLEETLPRAAAAGPRRRPSAPRRGGCCSGSTASSTSRSTAYCCTRRWRSGCWAWARRTSPPCARAARPCAPTWSISTSLLQDRDWLAGERLSLADFAAAAHLSVIDYFGDVPWRDFPAAKTWYMKLKSRPCFRPLLADRWPGLAPGRPL